jgi:hypothetical protein
MSKAKKRISLPATVLTTADSVEDIEDWILAHDKVAIEGLRELRRAHIAGKIQSLDKVTKKWRSK